MWDTRPVELVVELPEDLAEDAEQVRSADPDFFGKAIRYALARRIVFEELSRNLDAAHPGPLPRSS